MVVERSAGRLLHQQRSANFFGWAELSAAVRSGKIPTQKRSNVRDFATSMFFKSRAFGASNLHFFSISLHACNSIISQAMSLELCTNIVYNVNHLP